MTGSAPEAGDPMDVEAARRAVEDEFAELPLEIRLHAEEFEPEQLCVDRKRVRPIEAGGDRLVDELVGLRRLIGNRTDGSLEDVPVASHVD
jgi:hypothetical protein